MKIETRVFPIFGDSSLKEKPFLWRGERIDLRKKNRNNRGHGDSPVHQLLMSINGDSFFSKARAFVTICANPLHGV
jgi:hypothetical protein